MAAPPQDPGMDNPENQKLQAQVKLMQQQAAAQQQMINSQPQRPTYNSLMDPTTGMLKDQYNTHWGSAITADQGDINAIRYKAMAQGPSAWAQMALQKQGAEETGAKSQAEQQSNSARSSAENQLASTYGLSPAAQERLAMQGSRDLMNSQQNVGLAGQQARAQIGMQDESTKNQLLTQLPQYDFANANLAMQNRQGDLSNQQFNIMGAQNENKYSNSQNMDAYNAQMQAWAASKQAEATRQSGGGGKK